MPSTDAAILTKARAMAGQLLNEADYTELSRHNTVADAAAWLASKAAYKEVFDGADFSDINRSRLEFLLECSLIDRMLRLFRYTTGSSRKFMANLLEEYELRYLMIIIQKQLSGTVNNKTELSASVSASDSILMIPQALVDYSHLRFSELMASHGTDELLALLKGTQYYSVLAPLLAKQSSREDFSLIETLLYNSRRDRLCRSLKTMNKSGMAQMTKYLDSLADCTNISRALRIRRFNELSNTPADVKPYLSSGGTKRCRRELERIINAPDEKSAQAVAHGLLHGEDSDFLKQSAAMLLRQSSGISLAPVFGYLTLADAETEKIIGITEMIRYSR